MIMLAIFFVRAVILVQTEHVNDNFQELLRFCLFLVSWLEDYCKDLVDMGGVHAGSGLVQEVGITVR